MPEQYTLSSWFKGITTNQWLYHIANYIIFVSSLIYPMNILLLWEKKYYWSVFWPIMTFCIGAYCPIMQEFFWKGEFLCRKRRALILGSLCNIVACVCYMVFVQYFSGDISFDNVYNFIVIGGFFQGMAYHLAYNGQYQNYSMDRPVGLRYFQGSESGIYLFCTGLW
jgi:hypothetical protein